uniref:Uncharacterized protein LOC105851641 n=1 Tax=Cicer arietinum TaxID=3827 RepID=A0A1S3E054_CICAR|nr:uncharacterized protein LOC105851641 [Cicer arietinum]
MELYIDDVVVKSQNFKFHLVELEQALKRMKLNGLKMNPSKCAFRVSTRNFLGFLVYNKGIEVDKNKTRAILEARLQESFRTTYLSIEIRPTVMDKIKQKARVFKLKPGTFLASKIDPRIWN